MVLMLILQGKDNSANADHECVTGCQWAVMYAMPSHHRAAREGPPALQGGRDLFRQPAPAIWLSICKIEATRNNVEDIDNISKQTSAEKTYDCSHAAQKDRERRRLPESQKGERWKNGHRQEGSTGS